MYDIALSRIKIVDFRGTLNRHKLEVKKNPLSISLLSVGRPKITVYRNKITLILLFILTHST